MKLLICTQAVDVRDPILGFFHRWIEEFAKHCDEVAVICLREGEHSLPSNVKIFSLGKPSFAKASQGAGARLTYIFNFYKYLWQLRGTYDAVFVHMNPEYVILGGLWWRLVGKKVALWYEHKQVTTTLRLAHFFVNRVLTASKEGFRLQSKKVHVMGHGIDTRRDTPQHIAPQGVIRLMSSGRISPVKHIEVLIDAFLLLKRRGESVSFKIVGSAPSANEKHYESELNDRLSRAGEKPEDILVGSVSHAQMPQMRASVDYFLHASETGSLDKVVLDAIISGVVPVSSSAAYKELFEGFESLLNYPQGDSTALSERIVSLTMLSEHAQEEIRTALFERVVSAHSLQSLIPRILAQLS